jgi:hypothetical protein
MGRYPDPQAILRFERSVEDLNPPPFYHQSNCTPHTSLIGFDLTILQRCSSNQQTFYSSPKTSHIGPQIASTAGQA